MNYPDEPVDDYMLFVWNTQVSSLNGVDNLKLKKKLYLAKSEASSPSLCYDNLMILILNTGGLDDSFDGLSTFVL